MVIRAIAAALVLALSACGGGSGAMITAAAPPTADDTAVLQAILDAGGTVQLEARTYHFSKTLQVHVSGTIVVGSGSTVLEFAPPAGTVQHCLTDRAITTPCDFDNAPPRQVGAPINVADTSFQAAQASDLTDLSPGDWLLINDYDEDIGDRVAVDWAQVASIDGSSVNVTQPFRMSFTTARPWVAGKSGLGFEPIRPVVQGVEFRNLTVKVDATSSANIGALCIFGALNTTIDNITVNDPIGQPFYSYLSKGYTLTNSAANGGKVISEFAASVDLNITGNTFSSEAPGIGMDLGAGYFTVANNNFTHSANAGMYFLYGVHDGTVSDNTVAPVGLTTDASATGILILGSQNVAVTENDLEGGAGPGSIGIEVGAFNGGSLSEPDTGTTVSDNTFGSWVTQTILH